MYKELIDYFFQSSMQYRAVVVRNKTKLNHQAYHQTHNIFYYKTYYLVLKFLMEYNDSYKIYFDKKDTHGKEALNKLYEVFENSRKLPAPYLQHIHSHESQLLQLTDLFTGAVSYKNKDLNGSSIKNKIVSYLEQMSGIKLDMTSPLAMKKFNIFIQDPLRREVPWL